MMETTYQPQVQTNYEPVSTKNEEEREVWIRDTYTPTSD